MIWQKQVRLSNNAHSWSNYANKSLSSRYWASLILICCCSFLFLCGLSSNLASASTTKTEIYESNSVVLSDDELDEQIIRNLNNFHFEGVDENAREITIKEISERDLDIDEIYDLVLNHGDAQLVKPSKSTVTISSIDTNENNNLNDEGKIFNPTKSTFTNLGVSDQVVREILETIPDEDLSSTLIDLVFPADGGAQKLEDKLTIQEQHEIILRIQNLMPRGAKITGKWVRVDEDNNEKAAAVLADFLNAEALNNDSGDYGTGGESPILSEDAQFDALKKKAHEMIQDQVTRAFSHLEEEAKKNIQSQPNNMDSSHYNMQDAASEKLSALNKEQKQIDDNYKAIITAPCVDLYPKQCRKMKNSGNCHKAEHSTYMQEHCALSCDLCNPSISHKITGVPQDMVIKHSEKYKPISLILHQLEPQKLTQMMKNDMNKRIKNLIKHMTIYYQNGINQDDEDQRSMFHSCKNRHVACALWAVQGVCETKPVSMAITCGPACRLCHFKPDYHIDGPFDKKDGVTDHNSRNEVIGQMALSFSTSPFIRKDLRGVFEALEGNRIMRAWNGITAAATSNSSRTTKVASSQLSWHRFVALKHFAPILYKASENRSYTTQTIDYDENNRHPIHETSPVIAQFDTFLNEKECEYLLHLVKSLKSAEKTDNDGFGAHTTDARIRDDGRLEVIRTSSRKYVFPYSNDIDSFGNNSLDVLHPMIEQIFDRIELLTGVPRSNMEIPMLFDKFIRNQYHEAQPHSVQQNVAHEIVSKFPHRNDMKSSVGGSSSVSSSNFFAGESYEMDAEAFSCFSTTPDENPRTLGLTVFLNEDGISGGDVIFPLLENIRISPKMGRAILYPMVTSLDELGTDSKSYAKDKLLTMKMVMEGEEMKSKSWDEIALIAGAAFDAANAGIDYELSHNDMTKNDQTIISHTKVTAGVKYVVTFYLRLDSCI